MSFLKSSWSKIKKKYTNLMFQLEVPIVCHAEKIKIVSFPIKREFVKQM